MPTQFIVKHSNVNKIIDLPNAAGVSVVNGDLYVHDGTTPRKVVDAGDVGASLRVASGVAAVTGTLTVVTGLAAVTSVQATAQDDLDGAALAGVSATIGDQAGAPAAGSIILKAWKVTTPGAAGNPTLIAATAAKNINWSARGT